MTDPVPLTSGRIFLSYAARTPATWSVGSGTG
jgi:hypothetical protein